MKLEIHLCKGCIEDLKEYNPYIIPVTIKEVPEKVWLEELNR